MSREKTELANLDEEKFRIIFDSVNDAILIYDLDWHILEVNRTAQERLGYSRDELLKMTLMDIVTPEFADKRHERLDRLRRSGHAFFESAYVKRDGTIVPVEVNNKIIEFHGNPAVLSVVRDITERKEAEKALVASESRFKELFANSKNAIAIYEAYNNGEDFIIKDFNKSAEQIEGVKKDEIVGRKATEVFPGIVNFGLFDIFRRVWKTGVSEEHPISFYKDDRRQGWRENYVYKLPSGEIVAVYEDVTERRLKELEIEKISRFPSENPNPVLRVSKDGVIIYANKASKNLPLELGCEVGQNIPSYWHNIVLDVLISNQNKIVEFEHNQKASAFTFAPIIGENYVNIYGLDITERKLAEESLRKSEQKYSRIVNTANEGILSINENRVIDFVNKRMAEMLGYQPEEIIGNLLDNFIFAEDLPNLEKLMGNRKKGLSANDERRLRRKDGSTLWAIVSGTPIFDEENRFVGSFGMLIDITKQKQNENILKFSNRILEITNKHREMNPLLNEVINEIREITSCCAVGIRILDDKGDTLYNTHIGFDKSFYELESLFSIKNDNVIEGSADTNLPFFTEYGSFYSNGTTKLFTKVSKEDEGYIRNIFNQVGYESMALVPIRAVSKTLGLMIVADKRENMMPSEMVLILEKIATDLGQTIERVLSREALFAEKERLDVTLRSIGDAVITTDSAGNIAIINNVAERLTGWTEKEAVGKHINEVLHLINEKTRQPLSNPVEKVIVGGQITGLANHTVLISRDGTEYSVADSGSPIRGRDGNVIGVVIVFRDITEELRIEAELQKIGKLESLGILAGGIAHDFNNMLTAILGNLSLAKLYKDVDEKDKKLEDAEKAASMATGLTHQLLTFSKGGMPIKKLGSIKELLKDSATFALRGSNVKPIFSIQDDLWAVNIDQAQIDRVIHNVVINADQAMPSGGTIWINAENEYLQENQIYSLSAGKYVKITIKDRGIGISKEHLRRIFEPYYTTKQKGSGLGLATSYSIIRNHDGHVTVDSEVGIGTTFDIYLPASDESLSDKEINHDLLSIKSKGKILVMDDEEYIRTLMEEMLKNIGYEVTTSDDGSEAVRLYKQEMESGNFYDAVILDLTVPGGMGGKEAIEKFLEIDPKANVIVYSGYSNDAILSNYKDFGFKGVIVKPFKVKELSEVLYKVISNQVFME